MPDVISESSGDGAKGAIVSKVAGSITGSGSGSELPETACGATAILPRDGGAGSFAADGENALIVDTAGPDAGLAALSRLVEDPGLAARLGDRALEDMAAFAPEVSAARILEVLFARA